MSASVGMNRRPEGRANPPNAQAPGWEGLSAHHAPHPWAEGSAAFAVAVPWLVDVAHLHQGAARGCRDVAASWGSRRHALTSDPAQARAGRYPINAHPRPTAPIQWRRPARAHGRRGRLIPGHCKAVDSPQMLTSKAPRLELPPVISVTGRMATMRTVAPGVFVDFKRWMAEAAPQRDAAKRRRDHAGRHHYCRPCWTSSCW